MRLYSLRTEGRTALAVLCCLALLAAGCAAPGKEDAATVVDRSLKALGGRDALTGWKTQVSKGLMKTNRPGWGDLQADCTYLVEKPGKIVLDQDYSVFDHPFFFRYTYNDGDAWVMVNLGIRQNPRYTEMLADVLEKIDGFAYYAGHCDTLYAVPDTIPLALPDSIGAGTGFDRIAFVEGADTVYYDIDRKTRMPVHALDHNDQGGWNINLYDDFRRVGRIRMPFHEVMWYGGEKVREMLWNEITVDTPIDPAEFEKNRPPKADA